MQPTDAPGRVAALSATKRRLLERMRAGNLPAAFTPAAPRPGDAEPFLSLAQQRTWMEHALSPGKGELNVPLCARLEGPLDEAVLREALDAVCRRHEVLSSRFPRRAGRPAAVRVPDARVPFAVADVRPDDALRRLRAEAARPFDLERELPLRAVVLRLGGEHRYLMMVFHHIAVDESSFPIIVQDLAEAYGAGRGGRAWAPAGDPPSYSACARAERAWVDGPGGRAALDFWRGELADVAAAPALPTDHPRAVRAGAVASAACRVAVEPAAGRALRALARGAQTTPFTVFLAALGIALREHAAGGDVPIGTPVCTRAGPGSEAVVGLFINTVVLRARCAPERTLREIVRDTGAAAMRAFEHRALPFDHVVRALEPPRSPGAHPLFQAMLSYHRWQDPDAALEDVRVSWTDVEIECLKFDLLLSVHDLGEGFAGELRYDPALFRPATAAALGVRVEAVLGAMAADPDRTLADLSPRSQPRPPEHSMRDLPAPPEAPAAALPLGDLRLRRTRRSPLAAAAPAVAEAPYGRDQALPWVVRPSGGELDVLQWGLGERDRLRALRRTHGAVLLRGFQVRSAEHFSDFVRQVFDAPLEYRERSSRRRLVGTNVYTSTDHPASEEIFLHNENSYAATWPLVICFCCLQPAESGGETPLADVRQVYAGLPEALRERLRSRGCMYVRNFGQGLGLDWRAVFATEQKEDVQAYCDANDIGWEWLPGDRLRTRHVRPFLATHPESGEEVWFNHAVFFHASSLPRAGHDALTAAMAPDELPNNTFYEDGSPFEPEVIDTLRAAYRDATFQFPWQRGDVLVLDNMAVAHARRPFTGERRVVVGMADPYGAVAAAAGLH